MCFAGGFCLEAAEAVCAGDGLQTFAILDLLSRLVDKSLVTATTKGDTPRYEQLATLREFGEGLMAQRHEVGAVRQRHAEFYLFLAESIAPKLTGPEQTSGFRRLAQEADNMTGALQWFCETERHDAVCLAAALWRYWFVRGLLSLGRTQLAAALSVPESVAPDGGVSRAQALHGAGVLANDQGAYAAARAHFQAALVIRRQLEDQHGVAETLNSLAVAARDQGDYDTARTLLQEGLDIHRARDDSAGVASSIHALGITAHREGDCDAARRLFEEGLTLRQRSGDRRGIAALLAHLGSVAYDQETPRRRRTPAARSPGNVRGARQQARHLVDADAHGRHRPEAG